ncbi:MAG: helix-turn-helix domain-containing protein [Planctomycetota bacterium]|jgi:DNA-binding IclR family transcriptional regulator
MSDTVPGLIRGIEVLKLLEKSSPLNLEEISAETGFPKASVKRMLNSLIQLGLASKTESGKNYQALAKIVSTEGSEDSFDRQLEIALQQLAEKTGTTAEWFVPGKKAISLLRRHSPPEAEIHVKARTGSKREWNTELDSVAACSYALWNEAPEIKAKPSFKQYNREGCLIKITKKEAREMISKAKKSKVVPDTEFNVNGVKRLSAAVIHNDNLKGILTLAMPNIPAFKKLLPERKKLLVAAAKQLSNY